MKKDFNRKFYFKSNLLSTPSQWRCQSLNIQRQSWGKASPLRNPDPYFSLCSANRVPFLNLASVVTEMLWIEEKQSAEKKKIDDDDVITSREQSCNQMTQEAKEKPISSQSAESTKMINHPMDRQFLLLWVDLTLILTQFLATKHSRWSFWLPTPQIQVWKRRV